MSRIHPLGLLLSALSTVLFCAAFALPFVCSDFGFSSGSMKKTTEGLDDPCGFIVEGMNSATGSGFLGKTISKTLCSDDSRARDYSYRALNSVLGPVPTAEGELGWKECVDHPALHQQPISSCCAPTSPIETCLKWKVSAKLHLPLGDQYVLGIIQLLFQEGHLLLGALITIFSVLFPFSKVGMLFWLSVQERKPRWYALLKSSSRWSMTDVFVIGLLMIYFRADRFAFQFHAGWGVYCFAAAAIVSSIGISLISSRHHNKPK